MSDPESDPLRAQYEEYPYPARDPADERRRLIVGSPSHLAEIEHYLFAGRCDFSRGFRALIAGGGTGDAAIMLARQLADRLRREDLPETGAEIVYLDLSESARRIAEARARERGLSNLRFHSGSIFDLAGLGLGRFDYIDCCGVLHHLEDPERALRVLGESLDDGGGLGLMVYAPFGRTGVYPLQAALRTLSGELPLAERVALARRLLDALPPTNWLRRNPFLGDHRKSDAELVDLLLHARDRAYEIGEFVALLHAAGLRPAALIEPARYEPATYLSDRRLLEPLRELDWLARAAFAERIAGNVSKHIAYVVKDSRREPVVATLEGPEAIPVLRNHEGAELAAAVRKSLTLKASLDGLPLRFALPRLAPAILERIDGVRSLGEIHAALRELDSQIDWPLFARQFAQVHEALGGLNHLLLRYPVSRR